MVLTNMCFPLFQKNFMPFQNTPYFLFHFYAVLLPVLRSWDCAFELLAVLILLPFFLYFFFFG